MKLTKCINNHFYDADKYDSCPHCGAQSQPPKVRTGQPLWRGTEDRETERLSGASLWDSVDTSPPPTQPEYAPPPPAAQQQARPETPQSAYPAAPRQSPYQDAPTSNQQAAYADAPDTYTSAVQHPVYPGAPDAPPPQASPPSDTIHMGAPSSPPYAPPAAYVSDRSPAPVQQAPLSPDTSPSPLLQAVSEAAPYELPRQAAEQKTVSFYGLGETEPVVGWLVCVKGEYYGQSFNLKSGQNFIGRAVNMDVWLEKESSVSRNKHTVVVFDPKSRSFFVQPGESGGLTYLDGELVLTPAQLRAYSKISVGSCELVFTPFCGESFSWE